MTARRAEPLVLVLAACALAALGVVPAFDNVTHRVVALADEVPWSHAFLPFEMGFPIDAQALRPFSILYLKAHAAVFGVAEVVPDPVRWARGAVELSVFGLAARHWLRTAGLPQVAGLAALSSLVLAPTLFQAWLLTELDLVGAACLFVASAWLWDPQSGKGRALGAIVLLAGPMLLKESTALLAFGFLGGATLLVLREAGPRRARHLAACVVWTVIWTVLVAPMLSGPETDAAAVSLAEKLPLVEHNLVQLLYLASVPMAVLLLLAGLAAFVPVAARLAPVALLALLFLPLLVLYSHYEAIYFSPRGAGTGLAALLALGLALSARGRSKVVVACIAGGWGLLTLAGLVAPSAREDMASRIFIALAPLLHALGWDAARQLREHGGRTAVIGLAVCSAWWFVASGANYTSDWRARNAADVDGKAYLVERHLEGALLMFNHYVEWVDPWALRAAGAGDEVDGIDYVLMPTWVEPDDYKTASWIRAPGAEPPAIFIDGALRWFYRLAPRSRMSEHANSRLVGDLAWTRRDVGLFRPITEGGHNRPEDHRMTTYASETSPLETMLAVMGDTELEAEHAFTQLPLMITELPRRFLSGVPFVEDHAYEVAVWRFHDRPAPGMVPRGPPPPPDRPTEAPRPRHRGGARTR